MKNINMKRAIAAILTASMLTLSIVVFAADGACVQHSDSARSTGGNCEYHGLSTFTCSQDTYVSGNCNGTTDVHHTRCHAAVLGNWTYHTYDWQSCIGGNGRCKGVAHSGNTWYAGNWGACAATEGGGQ